MKWLKGIGYALAAALIAVGFRMLGRPARKQKRAEGQRDALLLDGSRKSRDKAIKFDEKANKHQADGVEAAAVGQKAISGVKDESMVELLDSFRSDSVQ